MISSKFYSQTIVCPVCSGWGTEESLPTKSISVCKECLGQGVSVIQSDTIYVWNAPTFIDYKSRDRILILKISAGILIFIFILMFITLLRFLISATFRV